MTRSAILRLAAGAAVGAVLLLALLLARPALPPGSAAEQSPRRLTVVTTVAPIADLARNVVGARAEVVQLVPDGVDSHTFEPRPTDALVLARADLIVLNGLSLEEPTRKLAEANRRPDAPILLLGEATIGRSEWIFDFSFPEAEGNPNPHLWINVPYAASYAALIAQQAGELDQPNAAHYAENLGKLRARLDQLDRAIFKAVESIPPQNRRLLTYHDSWAYFAKRYGMEVIGAVQPSDFAEPSPREIAALVDQVRAARLPAIFGSEEFPSTVLEAIARETGARFVTSLSDDALPGQPGDPHHTYVGMMLENLRTMTEALGGDASVFDGIDPGPVAG